ncbi:ATP-binding protein [Sphingomonas sp. M1-B02]|uniref:ATP-binding protein n=1 Tax=Sphingomonas sp. M1-B02 TaxID=3114300 RepID=UPI00223ED3A5|nr:ATP-binding protein [Sphingomonas sp. S6-11]UZK66659.1 ATP-binding protein [Sphingomonas sp. S6-11]
MPRWSNLALKATVIGTAICIVALVWALVLIQIQYERRETVSAAIRNNINRSIALEQYVARTLEGADLASAYVANRYSALLERNRLAPPSPIPIIPLGDFTVRSPAVREINIMNARGDLIATSEASPPPRVNVFETPIFQQHRSNPSIALRVNPPSRSRFSGRWLLLLTRRVNLRDGSFGGTVSVQIHPNELTNFFKDASISETELVSVIGLDGITRARRTGNTLSFGQDLRGTLVMRMQDRNPNGTYLGPSALDGLVRYFSHRRLSRYGIFVTSGVSEAAVLLPARARAGGYFAGATLIGLVIAIAAWLVLALIRRTALREAEIIAANARLRAAQRLARLGDWRFDIATETFHWSEDLCAMYERPTSPADVTLSDFGQLVGQHGLDIFRFALKEMQALRGRHEYELAARLPSGIISHRRIVAVPDFDAAGQLAGVHGTDQDITPRKLLESLQEQVGHLARIDGLNVIAATLAHELAQPLAAASNFLAAGTMRLAQEGEPDMREVIATLNATRGQILHAGEIIRRVRDLVRNREARADLISLREVIESAVTLSEAASPGARIDLSSLREGAPAKALADAVQVQQVLVNLIRNARDASRPREAAITIATSFLDSAFVLICVTDDGPGMASSGDDVFSPFTPSLREGLGVGLAICRTLVQAMGGSIWVAESGNSGTTVCFTLPRPIELAREQEVEARATRRSKVEQ